METITLWLQFLYNQKYCTDNSYVYPVQHMLVRAPTSKFSGLTRRKNRFRNALSQQNSEWKIYCELCKAKPDLNKLTESKQCQSSHKILNFHWNLLLFFFHLK